MIRPPRKPPTTPTHHTPPECWDENAPVFASPAMQSEQEFDRSGEYFKPTTPARMLKGGPVTAQPLRELVVCLEHLARDYTKFALQVCLASSCMQPLFFYNSLCNSFGLFPFMSIWR